MFCAAADAKGNYGTQLWVSYDVKFRLDAWEAPCSRIVLVAGTIAADEGRDRVPLLAVAAHAPHSHTPAEQRQRFWSLLQESIIKWRNRFPSAYVVLTIDANARVGSVKSSAFGQVEGVRENLNGSFLRTMLESQRMLAINTFQAGDWTWKPLRGKPS
eukprot:5055533-Pyramimonas_sp.AAC.1